MNSITSSACKSNFWNSLSWSECGMIGSSPERWLYKSRICRVVAWLDFWKQKAHNLQQEKSSDFSSTQDYLVHVELSQLKSHSPWRTSSFFYLFKQNNLKREKKQTTTTKQKNKQKFC